MKWNWKVALVVACMAVLLVGVWGCAAPAASSEDETVDLASGTITYDNREIAAHMEGNATTGYMWTSQVEGTGVKVNGDEYVADTEAGSTKAGEGGTHLFSYLADGSGEATITLKYARNWEASNDDKTVIIKTVSENGAFTSVAAEEK